MMIAIISSECDVTSERSARSLSDTMSLGSYTRPAWYPQLRLYASLYAGLLVHGMKSNINSRRREGVEIAGTFHGVE